MGERGPRPASRRVTLVLRRYRVIEEPVYGSWEAHESGCGALSGSLVPLYVLLKGDKVF